MNYRIGTRGSKLALVQTNYVKKCMEDAYPEDTFEIVVIRTKGDAVQNKPLAALGDKGLFVTEIEEGLQEHSIDMAVHSMKDMPGKMTDGMTFAKAWKREDPRDVLVLGTAECLADLPQGAVIGTGSLRRGMQLLKIRPDLKIVNIRGNVDTRLRKMKEQQMDGIVLAAAGIIRLGLSDVITQYLEPEEMIPAATQGTLAVELRADDTVLLEKLNALADEENDLCTRAERAYLAEVDADCHMPVGAFCSREEDGRLHLCAVYGKDDSAPLVYAQTFGNDPEQMASEAAACIRSQMEKADEEAEEAAEEAEIAAKTAAKASGIVYLLGAGPGDPELITVRGRELLKEADCIVYDRLAAPELLDYAKPETEKIYVGKADHHHTLTQDEINALLVEKAKQYGKVVRLKGGDPYVFGRGGEEGIFLREHGIAFEEIPGISSALAGLALAGIPITHRGVATGFHVITAHDKRNQMTDIDFSALMNPKDTCVFLMGLSKVKEIADGFLTAGRRADTPAAVISCATTAYQKTCTGTLTDIAQKVEEAGLVSPALIVVGDVVALREQLDTFEKRPLFGHRYLVPKIGSRLSRLSAELKAQGAIVDEVMTGEIRICGDVFSEKDFSRIDWIVFTSKNGVQGFFSLLDANKTDIRRLSHIRFAVVGDKTAEALREYHINADLIPGKATGKEVAALMKEQLPKGTRIWCYTAEKTSGELDQGLSEWADYHKVSIYRNEEPEILPPVSWENYEAVFFTSASSAKRLLAADQALGLKTEIRKRKEEGEDFRVYAIGKTCAKELEQLGITEIIVPEKTSYEAMIDAEVSKWQNMPIL